MDQVELDFCNQINGYKIMMLQSKHERATDWDW